MLKFKINRLISLFLFYYYSSLFSKSAKDYPNFWAIVLGSLSVCLYSLGMFIFQGVDVISIGYFIASLIAFLFVSLKTLRISYGQHQSLLKNTHYKSVHDFYLQRTF